MQFEWDERELTGFFLFTFLCIYNKNDPRKYDFCEFRTKFGHKIKKF